MDWLSLACCSLAFLLYYNTLDADFVYDDRRAVVSNPDVIGQTPLHQLLQHDFWGTPLSDGGSHGSYRPLCVASFRLNYAVSGLRPWSYHLVNVLLHCLATALVVRLARRLLPPAPARVGPAVAGLTFAAHPVHAEAVAGIVGRADLAACNVFLLSFFAYVEHVRLRDAVRERAAPRVTPGRRRRVARASEPNSKEGTFRLSCHRLVRQLAANVRGPIRPFGFLSSEGGGESESVGAWKSWFYLGLALVLAAAATLCKEPGITVLPICIIYDMLRGAQEGKLKSKGRVYSMATTLAACAALLSWRLQLGGGVPGFAAADNPAARDPSVFSRFYTFLYLPVFNFKLLLWPNTLSFDWSMDAVPKINSIFDSRNVASVIFYAVLTKTTLRALRAKLKVEECKESLDGKISYKRKKNYHTSNSYSNITLRQNGFSAEKSNYHAPYRETISHAKKYVCKGCRHGLTSDHSSACRTLNNNNATHKSACACSHRREPQTPRARVVERSHPQAALVLALAFLALPFLPASNLFFYVGFVVAERVLYVPSVGYCLLVGLGAGAAWRHARARPHARCWLALLLVTLAAMSARTLRRNRDWRDDESLFRSAVHINPPRAYGNLGSVLSSQGRAAEAELAYRQALLHRHTMADVHYNLGVLLHSESRYQEAVKSLEKAIFYRPSMALAYVNLGVSLVATGRISEAARVLRAGACADGARVRDRRAHDAARVSALVQLAGLQAARALWHQALAAYREALDILPPRPVAPFSWTRHSILTLMGDAHAQVSQWREAELATRAALAADPTHAPAHLAYARILARNSTRSMEAEKWFKRAIYHAPHDPNIRHQFGEFLWSQRRAGEAAEQLVRAAQLEPETGARAAAAARALRHAGDCAAAELWYTRAARLDPENAENHSNLGAILHLNGKYSQAASSYRKALKLLPGDETVLTNLRRVRTLMATAAARADFSTT